VATATWSTAARKASDVAALGLATPLTFRTYCSAAARISVSVAGGSRPRRVVMLRHMGPVSRVSLQAWHARCHIFTKRAADDSPTLGTVGP